MLTSWYPAFFYLITLTSALFIYLFTNLKKKKQIIREFKISSIVSQNLSWLIALPISIFILAVWIYVHFPVLGETSRSWPETIYYSSYLSQVLNQQYLNNGWFFIFVKDSQYTPFQQSNVD
jgi:hypothetical protein